MFVARTTLHEEGAAAGVAILSGRLRREDSRCVTENINQF